MDIKSAIVLITSAGSLLGSTLALHFVQQGAKVILCDSDKEGLNECFQRCKEIGVNVDSYCLPDYSTNSLNRMLDDIERTYDNAPDVLINNWPTAPMPSLVDEQPTELFISKLAIMASSLFSFSQVCTERMRQHHIKGVIVNIVFNGDYHNASGIDNATYMVTGFTQSWAKELMPFNIRVGGVVPMYTATRRREHWAEIKDDLIRNTEYIVANEYFSGRVMSA